MQSIAAEPVLSPLHPVLSPKLCSHGTHAQLSQAARLCRICDQAVPRRQNVPGHQQAGGWGNHEDSRTQGEEIIHPYVSFGLRRDCEKRSQSFSSPSLGKCDRAIGNSVSHNHPCPWQSSQSASQNPVQAQCGTGCQTLCHFSQHCLQWMYPAAIYRILFGIWCWSLEIATFKTESLTSGRPSSPASTEYPNFKPVFCTPRHQFWVLDCALCSS